MKKTKESGITLISLVITIIMILILASIGVTAGTSTINVSRFNQFKNEIEMIQAKVNEANQNGNINIGENLTEEQAKTLEIKDVSDVIYKDKTDDEKAKIKDGFKYFSKQDLEKYFDLSGVKRDYLINIEYRYVVSLEGVKYNDKTYYMAEEENTGLYNVEYKDKNSKTGSFDVKCEKEKSAWHITIINIRHDGYVSNWQVKYKKDGDSNWKTSNYTDFYITQKGDYTIKVVHGNEIDLGTKKISVGTDEETKNMTNNEITENTINAINTTNVETTGTIEAE